MEEALVRMLLSVLSFKLARLYHHPIPNIGTRIHLSRIGRARPVRPLANTLVEPESYWEVVLSFGADTKSSSIPIPKRHKACNPVYD